MCPYSFWLKWLSARAHISFAPELSRAMTFELKEIKSWELTLGSNFSWKFKDDYLVKGADGDSYIPILPHQWGFVNLVINDLNLEKGKNPSLANTKGYMMLQELRNSTQADALCPRAVALFGTDEDMRPKRRKSTAHVALGEGARAAITVHVPACAGMDKWCFSCLAPMQYKEVLIVEKT